MLVRSWLQHWKKVQQIQGVFAGFAYAKPDCEATAPRVNVLIYTLDTDHSCPKVQAPLRSKELRSLKRAWLHSALAQSVRFFFFFCIIESLRSAEVWLRVCYSQRQSKRQWHKWPTSCAVNLPTKSLKIKRGRQFFIIIFVSDTLPDPYQSNNSAKSPLNCGDFTAWHRCRMSLWSKGKKGFRRACLRARFLPQLCAWRCSHGPLQHLLEQKHRPGTASRHSSCRYLLDRLFPSSNNAAPHSTAVEINSGKNSEEGKHSLPVNKSTTTGL